MSAAHKRAASSKPPDAKRTPLQLGSDCVVDARTVGASPNEVLLDEMMNDRRSRIAYLARDMVYAYFHRRYLAEQSFLDAELCEAVRPRLKCGAAGCKGSRFVGMADGWMCFLAKSRVLATSESCLALILVSHKGRPLVAPKALPPEFIDPRVLSRVFLDEAGVPTFVAVDIARSRLDWSALDISDDSVNLRCLQSLPLDSSLRANIFARKLLGCDSVAVPDRDGGRVLAYSFLERSSCNMLGRALLEYTYNTCDPTGLVLAGGHLLQHSPSDSFSGSVLAVPRIHVVPCERTSLDACPPDHYYKVTEGCKDTMVLCPHGRTLAWIDRSTRFLYLAEAKSGRLLISRQLPKRFRACITIEVTPFFTSPTSVSFLHPGFYYWDIASYFASRSVQ